jgi:hypothetical protein
MKDYVGFRGIGEELSLLEHIWNGDIVLNAQEIEYNFGVRPHSFGCNPIAKIC